MEENDFITREILKHIENSNKALDKIAFAVDKINDSNILHANAISENSDAIKKLVHTNNAFLALFKWIIFILLAAIVVIAGAEEALKIFG